MSRFVILLGGDLTVTSRLRRQIAGVRFIAADSGMRHASALGVHPELWVGDFDSAGSELRLDYAHVPRQSYPSEKDKTDGEIAVNEAVKLGASEIILLGGLGGQADHVTAHLGLTLRLAKAGSTCWISNGEEEAYPITEGAHGIDVSPGCRLSIIPWSDIAGFTLAGVRWPLKDVKLSLGSSYTMSNIATGPVRMSLASGIGIVFAYPQETD